MEKLPEDAGEELARLRECLVEERAARAEAESRLAAERLARERAEERLAARPSPLPAGSPRQAMLACSRRPS